MTQSNYTTKYIIIKTVYGFKYYYGEKGVWHGLRDNALMMNDVMVQHVMSTLPVHDKLNTRVESVKCLNF